MNSDISTYFSTFELVEIYQSFIDDYSAYGTDFDLENGQYNISNICEALKVVTKNNPRSRYFLYFAHHANRFN